MSNNEIVYIDKVDSYRTIWTNVRIGNRKPLHCTALGKAFLAFSQSNTRDLIINQINLTPYTNHTITDKEILRNNIESLKKHQWKYQ